MYPKNPAGLGTRFLTQLELFRRLDSSVGAAILDVGSFFRAGPSEAHPQSTSRASKALAFMAFSPAYYFCYKTKPGKVRAPAARLPRLRPGEPISGVTLRLAVGRSRDRGLQLRQRDRFDQMLDAAGVPAILARILQHFYQ